MKVKFGQNDQKFKTDYLSWWNFSKINFYFVWKWFEIFKLGNKIWIRKKWILFLNNFEQILFYLWVVVGFDFQYPDYWTFISKVYCFIINQKMLRFNCLDWKKAVWNIQNIKKLYY